jgi:hypothetical protein
MKTAAKREQATLNSLTGRRIRTTMTLPKGNIFYAE